MNLNFKKIEVTSKEESKNKASFKLSPLNRGFGNTLGNGLRRVLMSSIPGSAVIGMKIDGTAHEFERIVGSVNTGVELIREIKKMKFAVDLSDEKVHTLKFSKKAKGKYSARDIELPDGVKCLTPDIEFIALNGTDKVEIEFYLKNGVGFVDASQHRDFDDADGENIITIDAMYSPIVSVNYVVIDEVRVGREANFEEVIINVETNGELTAVEAMKLAGRIHIQMLSFIDDMKEYVGEIDILEEEKEKENQILDMKLEELMLSARPYKKLKESKYDTVGKILTLSKREILALGNLGKVSIEEIEKKLLELGYSLKED